MERPSSWIVGFLPGVYLELYAHYTSQELLKQLALKTMMPFRYREKDRSTHDIGVIMLSSYQLALDTPSVVSSESMKADLQNAILNAASSLASRFNWVTGCTRSWDNFNHNETNPPPDGFQVIIYNIMNIGLFVAGSSLPGGDPIWLEMAKSHANKTLQNHVRNDGSSFHLVTYNQTDGQVIKRTTAQGYAPLSTWARGQAWGIYGFTKMFKSTQDSKYLDAAKAMVQYYFSRIPLNHFVPKWDFDAPGDPLDVKLQDTSAAAVVASACLDLANLTNSKEYFDLAANTFRYLFLNKETYLPGLDSPVPWKGVLQRGAGNVLKNLSNHALIYGDFYLLEALRKYETFLNV
jgi:hypothetical protein